MTIDIIVDESKVAALVRSQDERVSPHTGRSLAILNVEARIATDKGRSDDIARSLREQSAAVRTADGRRFAVRSSSLMHIGQSPLTTVTMELEEVEDVIATAVVIGDSLRLVPERYREEYRNGAVILEMTVATAGEATIAFEEAHDGRVEGVYFPVIREGVQDEPLLMRFGHCVWQEREDGSRLHLIILVQDTYDANNNLKLRGFNEPDLSRAKDAIVALQTIVDTLLRTIVDAGLMTSDQASALRRDSKNVSLQQLRQFDRADNIEDHWTP
jgi:hypothetical protein